jgi:hypothetical protein
MNLNKKIGMSTNWSAGKNPSEGVDLGSLAHDFPQTYPQKLLVEGIFPAVIASYWDYLK